MHQSTEGDGKYWRTRIRERDRRERERDSNKNVARCTAAAPPANFIVLSRGDFFPRSFRSLSFSLSPSLDLLLLNDHLPLPFSSSVSWLPSRFVPRRIRLLSLARRHQMGFQKRTHGIGAAVVHSFVPIFPKSRPPAAHFSSVSLLFVHPALFPPSRYLTSFRPPRACVCSLLLGPVLFAELVPPLAC